MVTKIDKLVLGMCIVGISISVLGLWWPSSRTSSHQMAEFRAYLAIQAEGAGDCGYATKAETTAATETAQAILDEFDAAFGTEPTVQ